VKTRAEKPRFGERERMGSFGGFGLTVGRPANRSMPIQEIQMLSRSPREAAISPKHVCDELGRMQVTVHSDGKTTAEHIGGADNPGTAG
jgi:hypothetical protein